MIHLCHPSNLFSHCVPFPVAHWRAGLPGCLRLPMFIIGSLGHKMAGIFPLPAICWHCFSRCLRTSEHLDFLLPLQHFNMSHIISRLLIVQLTFLSFVFLFVMHIFKFWHITHINYWGKKRPPSCLLLWMPGLDCCSCQQGDQRDVWVEEAFCIGCKSPSV